VAECSGGRQANSQGAPSRRKPLEDAGGFLRQDQNLRETTDCRQRERRRQRQFTYRLQRVKPNERGMALELQWSFA